MVRVFPWLTGSFVVPVIRQTGHTGEFPVPGWTDDYEWLGYIPFEQHPYVLNPEQDYIVSANNAVVGMDYPYIITTRWAYGYRAQRIVDMIEQAPGPVTSAYVQQIHGDNKDLNAETLVPILMEIPLNDSRLEAVRELFQGWDFQDQMDLAAPALFNAFWQHLLARTFQDDLPERYWPGGGSRWFEVMRHLVQQPDSSWWDDHTTPQVEMRDQIFTLAFKDGVGELEASLGKDLTKWTWGDLHTLVFKNQALGSSGIAPIEALFNRGPYRVSGSDSVVNATGWSAKDPYQVVGLPSMRMIVDLKNLDQSLSINTTGQSGHAYNQHYVDMADLYRKIQYHPMLWSLDQVSGSELDGHLVLAP